MKAVSIDKISRTECAGIQINGLSHCRNINCKWQGLSACNGKRIIETGYNLLGYKIGLKGLAGE